MSDASKLIKAIDYIAFVLWGYNIFDFTDQFIKNGMTTNVDGLIGDAIKIMSAIAGLVYFVFKIIHLYKNNKLDRVIKQQQIDKTAFENMMLMKQYSKKKNETK